MFALHCCFHGVELTRKYIDLNEVSQDLLRIIQMSSDKISYNLMIIALFFIVVHATNYLAKQDVKQDSAVVIQLHKGNNDSFIHSLIK